MRRSWSAGWCSLIHDNLESHSSPIRQSSFPNLWVSPIINIDVDTQILPVTGADNSCCGWTESGPVSAPDTLQLYVTDAWRVHTHINTLRHGMKSPYLTPGFSPPPPPLSFVLWVYVTRCGPTTNLIKMRRCDCVCLPVCACDRLWDSARVCEKTLLM